MLLNIHLDLFLTLSITNSIKSLLTNTKTPNEAAWRLSSSAVVCQTHTYNIFMTRCRHRHAPQVVLKHLSVYRSASLYFSEPCFRWRSLFRFSATELGHSFSLFSIQELLEAEVCNLLGLNKSSCVACCHSSRSRKKKLEFVVHFK